MNKILLEEIVKHVFANLAIIPSDFINSDKTTSLMSKQFLLNKKIKFDLDDDNVIENDIWGCQISANDNELKLLLADCSQDKNIHEYCLIVQLANAPAYALYFVDIYPKSKSDESMIACSVKKVGWMECSTYLQATFLAGMEQLKDLALKWNKCQDYSELYNTLLSFIKYHDSYCEEQYEG